MKLSLYGAKLHNFQRFKGLMRLNGLAHFSCAGLHVARNCHDQTPAALRTPGGLRGPFKAFPKFWGDGALQKRHCTFGQQCQWCIQWPTWFSQRMQTTGEYVHLRPPTWQPRPELNPFFYAESYTEVQPPKKEKPYFMIWQISLADGYLPCYYQNGYRC